MYLNLFMLRLSKIIAILSIGFLLLNCQQSNSYKYNDGLLLYLDKIGVDTSVSLSILVVPVGDCNSCIAPAVNYLFENDPLVDLVIFTAAYNEDIKRKENVIYDTSGILRQYQTGVFGPVFFKLQNKKIYDFENLNAKSFEEFKERIQNILSP